MEGVRASLVTKIRVRAAEDEAIASDEDNNKVIRSSDNDNVTTQETQRGSAPLTKRTHQKQRVLHRHPLVGHSTLSSNIYSRHENGNHSPEGGPEEENRLYDEGSAQDSDDTEVFVLLLNEELAQTQDNNEPSASSTNTDSSVLAAIALFTRRHEIILRFDNSGVDDCLLSSLMEIGNILFFSSDRYTNCTTQRTECQRPQSLLLCLGLYRVSVIIQLRLTSVLLLLFFDRNSELLRGCVVLCVVPAVGLELKFLADKFSSNSMTVPHSGPLGGSQKRSSSDRRGGPLNRCHTETDSRYEGPIHRDVDRSLSRTPGRGYPKTSHSPLAPDDHEELIQIQDNDEPSASPTNTKSSVLTASTLLDNIHYVKPFRPSIPPDTTIDPSLTTASERRAATAFLDSINSIIRCQHTPQREGTNEQQGKPPTSPGMNVSPLSMTGAEQIAALKLLEESSARRTDLD
ncbi:hypothetical protein PROFUN_15600 [Planoprotostelium fungivorum]|uniref:Uncharacterized protein n=1 Tax=Planoprotostelium fungivorum TaxID=1890364 RepID=A0A2P6MV76_9EUKA|nr:hypothetical protein PROFUN_15600 [Planoprotostelium fungivorum]